MTLLLDDESKERLTILYRTLGRSRGQILRDLINLAFHMHMNNIPFCANGQRCLAPQMHQNITPTPRS